VKKVVASEGENKEKENEVLPFSDVMSDPGIVSPGETKHTFYFEWH